MMLERSLERDQMSDKLSNPVDARKKAMDYLARREHGRAELIAKLSRAGFDMDVADAAVAELVVDKLQSDERFVEAFIASRINQGKGPVKIRADLRERDIAAAVIDDGLRNAAADWTELARQVRARKFGAGLPRDFRDKARQMRFLQARGFDSDQIQAAVSASAE